MNRLRGDVECVFILGGMGNEWCANAVKTATGVQIFMFRLVGGVLPK